MTTETVQRTERETADGARRRLSVIDSDVHHGYRDKSDLYSFLPQVYRERLADFGYGGGDGYANNEGGLGWVPAYRWKMAGDRTLMFASDYPHWDWDDPAQIFATLPNELRQRIFVENARETF